MNTTTTRQVDGLRQGIAGFLVFLFPFIALMHRSGTSAASFGFLVMALVYWRECRGALGRAWPQVRWVVLAFAIHFVYALALFALRADGELSSVEKPARMFFSVSAMLVVLAFRPRRRAFYWGVALGALAGAVFVGYQRFGLGMDRPGGTMNAITFGDLSLALGLVAIAAATELRTVRHALVLITGAIAGLAGLLFTGTRGALVGLAVSLAVFLRFSAHVRSRIVLALAAAGAAMFVVAYFIPETGVQARIDEGLVDVRTYRAGGEVNTRVGTRLELWKAGSILAAERPWFGQEDKAFHARMEQLVRDGRLDKAVLPLAHLHNDALQKLVTGGVFGLAAWLSILVAPFMFFRSQLRQAGGDRRAAAPALAGLVVVASYASFGLTEVIFWSVGGSLFYSLMVFLLMGFCLNAKESDGN